MPAPLPDLVTHAVELLRPLGPVRVRRMFGGYGLYADDVFVSIIVGDTLYLKVDADTRDAFAAAGSVPFVYEAKGKHVSLGYMTAPDDAMESPDAMRRWGRSAMQAAVKARAQKVPVRKPAAKTTAARPSAKAVKAR